MQNTGSILRLSLLVILAIVMESIRENPEVLSESFRTILIGPLGPYTVVGIALILLIGGCLLSIADLRKDLATSVTCSQV